MDEVQELPFELELNNKEQFAKLIIGTVVGFFATKMAEKAFDQYIKAHR